MLSGHTCREIWAAKETRREANSLSHMSVGIPCREHQPVPDEKCNAEGSDRKYPEAHMLLPRGPDRSLPPLRPGSVALGARAGPPNQSLSTCARPHPGRMRIVACKIKRFQRLEANRCVLALIIHAADR